MSENSPNNILRNTIGLQLMVLFGSFFICLLVTSLLAEGIKMISSIEEKTALFLASSIQCVFAFCVPAYLTARFASSKPLKWLDLNTYPPFKSIIGVVIVYFLALPAMNQLIAWNSTIHFPECLNGIETTLRNWEDAGNSISSKMLSSTGIGGVIAGVAIIGVLTGFSEEIFFRGALQGIFVKAKIGAAVSIWGAAFIFSAIHFQFFGFLPRLLMGAFFGYLFLWSRSLWLPAFAHALNNSIVVLTASPLIGIAETTDFDSFGTSQDGYFPWGALASGTATFLFLWRFKNFFFKKTMDNIHNLIE